MITLDALKPTHEQGDDIVRTLFERTVHEHARILSALAVSDEAKAKAMRAALRAYEPGVVKIIITINLGRIVHISVKHPRLGDVEVQI